MPYVAMIQRPLARARHNTFVDRLLTEMPAYGRRRPDDAMYGNRKRCIDWWQRVHARGIEAYHD